MRPTFLFVLVIALVMGLTATDRTAFAKEGKDGAKAKEPAPQIASDEEVKAALAQFKSDYKAKGLKGDERTMQRDYAMEQLAKVQHPDTVKALEKITKSGDSDLRLLAVIYLGTLDAVPGLAGEAVHKALKRNMKDPVFTLTALQAISSLGYMGAGDTIEKLLRHRDYMYVKAAIQAIGDTKDARRIWDIMKLVGVLKVEEGSEGSSSSGPIVVSEGYSWDGAEAVVDRGEADNTQENADAKKQAEAQIAKNKAAAAAGAGRGGGGAGGALGGGRAGRGGSSRNPKELIPPILAALKSITGEEFANSKDVAEWARKNLGELKKMAKDCEEKEDKQKKLAKERK